MFILVKSGSYVKLTVKLKTQSLLTMNLLLISFFSEYSSGMILEVKLNPLKLVVFSSCSKDSQSGEILASIKSVLSQ